ncbi:MAG TPA: hypothetical protein VMT86_18445 [Bryobacteraceae bacterium]|nr:hypothetical protein [Bryobacteraceae bacterium]
MASSISPLSYLDPSAYQNLNTTLSEASSTGDTNGVSSTAEVQALQSQGSLQSFLNNSLAAALLQPADVTSGLASSTLIDNLLQQVLGAYQSQMNLSQASTS